MKTSNRKTRSDKFPLTVQRLLGHAGLTMATRYVQDVSAQTDRVIKYVLQ